MGMDTAYVYCLDARNGSIIWYKKGNNLHPLGSITASKEFLFISQGAMAPRAYSLNNGNYIKFGFKLSGTDPVLIEDQYILCGGRRKDGIGAGRSKYYAIQSLPGKPEFGGIVGDYRTNALAFNIPRRLAQNYWVATPVVSQDKIYLGGPMAGVQSIKIDSVINNKSTKRNSNPKSLWKIEWEYTNKNQQNIKWNNTKQNYFMSIIKAENKLIVARPDGQNKTLLLIIDESNGTILFKKSISGKIIENSLAVAYRSLFASLTNGEIICLSPQD